MTSTNAQDRIRNIIDSETTAYFSNGELDEFMKMATDEFWQQYYMGFEATQDSRDKLSDLVISKEVDFIDTTPVSIGTMDNSDTYGRFLSAYVKGSPSVNVKVIQIGDISAYLNDPFNKADSSNPVIYFKEGNIYSIGFTDTTKLVVTYLQYTTDFTDLSDTTHEEVCQIAARKVLATLGDPRYQAVQTEISERRV
jgi:hypothetical protein